jgi:D-2-hydroxyacid dehydrogenase (NADP+)
MRSRAIFINLARGGVVHEPSLIEALREGRIAGAGLDVFATEPLPRSSPLWAMDNVLVTPHIGGMSDVYVEQILPLVIENVRAFLRDRPGDMRNIVRR